MRIAATLLLLASPLALAAPLLAQSVDDSDLGGRRLTTLELRSLEKEGRVEGGTNVYLLFPEAGPRPGTAGAVSGLLELADRQGAFHPARLSKARLIGSGAGPEWSDADGSGRFSLPIPSSPSGTYRVRASLDNRFWAFRNPGGRSAAYEWESPPFTLSAGQGLELGALRPDPASENGKLGVLHLTYLEALDLPQREADTDWWDRTLTVNWPGEADFFSPWGWSLTLTNAVAWDVVLHELGHAVMHGAMKASPAGGQHKIDECYNAALAWSEGWATFFAAAVRLSRDDSDAKFEFLVPRRAPIRIENVPDDVCKGESSEWRVASGLWDLLDTHPDGGDRLALPFQRIWTGLRGKSMGSMSSAWQLIAKDLGPLERRAGEDALIHNTLMPPRPALAVRMPAVPPDWLDKN